MAILTSRHGSSWLPERAGDRWRSSVGRRAERTGPSTGLLIAGAVVVGLGVLTWVYLGPDLRRYLKIQSM
jgi:hypothetical protein